MQTDDAIFKQITSLQKSLTDLRFHHWLHFELFKLQWWLLVAVFILPWIVWIKIVDKRVLKDVFLYGTVTAFVITMLDATGCDLGLWAYVYKAIPLYNRCIAVDVGILPVIFMMVYQYCRKWRTFVIVHVLLAAIFAFIMEPLALLIGICVYYHWKCIYSFPIYIAVPICLRYVFEKLQQSTHTFEVRP